MEELARRIHQINQLTNRFQQLRTNNRISTVTRSFFKKVVQSLIAVAKKVSFLGSHK